MGTPLHWVEGAWPGTLALSARPRGGDWVEDEMTHWRAAGVDTVVSLLQPQEALELGLATEQAAAARAGIAFFNLPVEDRGVPESRSIFVRDLELVAADLRKGKHVIVHCRQGVGRAGLTAAALLLGLGEELPAALRKISAARGVSVPETEGQLRWLESLAQLYSVAA